MYDTSMRLHFNTMVKDEEDLLEVILPKWLEYPIDTFVFYDDNSSDNTVDVIKKHIPSNRLHIIKSSNVGFNESYNRSQMLEYSRDSKADYVFSIDSDELLSSNFNGLFLDILANYKTHNFLLYWYNVVNESVLYTRHDPAYVNNYRSFILPLKYTERFDLAQWKYHSPRTPHINLPTAYTKDIGVIHLQAINTRFYALKQLWYKHFEYVNYGHSVEYINERYDPVVNNLNFQAINTPESIINDLVFDSSVFNTICNKKGYLEYIKRHYNKSLITFGEEYL